MIKLKTIPLYPTHFRVDVWLANNLSLLAEQFHLRYGASAEYYENSLTPNQCMHLISTSESELKGEHIIVVNMKNPSCYTLIHEMNHVVYYLAKLTNVELSFDSQEWHSYMLEYLYENASQKDYKLIK